MRKILFFQFSALTISSVEAFVTPHSNSIEQKLEIQDVDEQQLSLVCSSSANFTRRKVLSSALSTLFTIGVVGVASVDNALAIPEQKSYSSNARNIDRLSNGDSSGGSIYDNNPPSPAARRRRAMVGCKIESSRKEASKLANLDKTLSERECNIQVMGGDTELVIQALINLDCPTCPYGIEGA